MDRKIYGELELRLSKKRSVIQLVTGPRQVGKTTMMLAYQRTHANAMYYSVDDFPVMSPEYMDLAWDECRRKISSSGNEGVLILDEVQKISGWDECVKKNWDRDTRDEIPLKIVLTGSSRLLLQYNINESLAGRFLSLYVPYWSYQEMHEAFGFDLDHYIYFGGYPGAATFTDDERLWRNYIVNSLIEPTIGQDILMLTPVLKPALLRQTFDLSSLLSSQIVSFQKLLGQLQDAGNTATLANYLELLNQASMVSGLEKFSYNTMSGRNSIPKMQVHNNAFLSSKLPVSFENRRSDPSVWGRLVESAIGAYLLNWVRENGGTLGYWRDGNLEVDYVLQYSGRVIAIEVKSGNQGMNRGLAEFHNRFPDARCLLVSERGGGLEVTVDDFLSNIESFVL